MAGRKATISTKDKWTAESRRIKRLAKADDDSMAVTVEF